MIKERTIIITKNGEIHVDKITRESAKRLIKEFVSKTKEGYIAFDNSVDKFKNTDTIIVFKINFYSTIYIYAIKNILSTMNFDETKKFIENQVNL